MPRELVVVPTRVSLLAEVRGQPVAVHETINPADRVPTSRWARASSIGRTFVDTLDAPGHCGGIATVLIGPKEYATELSATRYVMNILSPFRIVAQV